MVFLVNSLKIMEYFLIFWNFFSAECTDSALVMLVDSVDEFYKSLMDRINLIIISQRKDRRVSSIIYLTFFFHQI